MHIDLQINIDGQWVPVATFDKRPNGGWLEYDAEYVIDQGDSPHNRASLLYPANFELYDCALTPAFLVDITPSGASRRIWLRRLGQSEDAGSALDWDLLTVGAGNPPGNLRVLQAAIESPIFKHPGFTMDDIVAKNSDFIEYAEEMGAVVAGATDIPGDAPKFMVVTDSDGRWHPDGALAPEEVVNSWIVKFPRGKDPADRLVLRNEAPYYEVARWFGIRVGAPLFYRDNSLFIPRFDRERHGDLLLRHGLETVCSAANISDYGRRGDHLRFCQAIVDVATNPASEILEYLKRDILNTSLRNIDNHGRNTAFIKKRGRPIELSPLYDFAPMSLDPEGMARASLWTGMENKIGLPDWGAVARSLREIVDLPTVLSLLADHSPKVAKLPAVMKQLGVEEKVIQEVARRCEAISSDLKKAVLQE